MKKSTLSKKLKSYSALASSAALFVTQTEAQIIYTDVSPDSTVNVGGNFYNLDLNNDGTFDFVIHLNIGSGTATSQQVAITPLASNGVAGDTVGMYIYPRAFNTGDTVKTGLQFNLGSAQSMASYAGPGNIYGHWIGATDKYLGLNFFIGTTKHYGWARLDIDSSANKFTIKDYAYNATPDSMIIVGQTGLNIKEINFSNNILIYSYDKNIKITFLNELPREDSEVKITNTLGQEIYRSAITNKEMDINLDNKKAGIYLVTIIQRDNVFTKKINLR